MSLWKKSGAALDLRSHLQLSLLPNIKGIFSLKKNLGYQSVNSSKMTNHTMDSAVYFTLDEFEHKKLISRLRFGSSSIIKFWINDTETLAQVKIFTEEYSLRFSANSIWHVVMCSLWMTTQANSCGTRQEKLLAAWHKIKWTQLCGPLFCLESKI